LAAAILLARAGRAVTLHEAAPTIGGGTRTAELTLPGFLHDVCSAVHPMAVSSPCFDLFPLAAHGLEWIHSPAPLAHPLDDGSAVMLERSVDATARNLGADGPSWRRLMEPLASAWPQLREDILAPLTRLPRHPFSMARFGLQAIRSVRGIAESHFSGERAKALFAGIGAHAVQPLEAPLTGAIGLALAVAGHAVGWPIPRAGSQQIAESLAGYFRSLGGEIVVNSRITALPDAPLVLCDTAPKTLAEIGGSSLPEPYRRQLTRFRYGAGVYKMDFALDGPIPWRASECLRAATVHVGGTLDEISEWESKFTGRPFLLVAQSSLFDNTRAPEGKHTVWAYCHVPNGSSADMSRAIEDQIERFAPGFRGRILARSVRTPAELERDNANLVGGDVTGGVNDWAQTLARPTLSHYRTPLPNVFLCSASTPPGGSVHGMCGYWAAKAALRRVMR
jgi:phytoene dehydrogenase-like protein